MNIGKFFEVSNTIEIDGVLKKLYSKRFTSALSRGRRGRWSLLLPHYCYICSKRG